MVGSLLAPFQVALISSGREFHRLNATAKKVLSQTAANSASNGDGSHPFSMGGFMRGEKVLHLFTLDPKLLRTS